VGGGAGGVGGRKGAVRDQGGSREGGVGCREKQGGSGEARREEEKVPDPPRSSIPKGILTFIPHPEPTGGPTSFGWPVAG
jgi:hypothetical protein